MDMYNVNKTNTIGLAKLYFVTKRKRQNYEILKKEIAVVDIWRKNNQTRKNKIELITHCCNEFRIDVRTSEQHTEYTALPSYSICFGIDRS